MKQHYDSYKPSGIDWIGDIPEHWNIRKTSQLFLGIGSGTTPTSGDPKYYSAEGINWLQTGDLNDGKIIFTSKKITETAIRDFSSLKIYPKGSIVIAMYGATIGKLGILNIETTTNQACCVLPYSNVINQNYAFYVYRAGKQSLINSAYGGGQPNISQDTIKSFKIPMPPLSEQQAIADYLDKKCGEIDAAIAKVDREIELIDELKQSEISRVVTRGLNPDTPLRPSGIDWIGDIPEHWEIRRIRDIIEKSKNGIKIGPFGSALTGKVKTNLPYKVYGQWNIVDKDFRAGIGSITLSTFDNLRVYEVIPNDILVSMMGTIGKCSIVPSDIRPGIMDSHVVKIRLNSNLYSSRYFEYVYDKDNSNIIISELHLRKKGSIMDGLNSSIIKNLYVPVPPLAEQQAIADYLDKKCAEIDGLKAKLSKKRETLTKLRQSIISEVVTGKRKVI